MAHSYYSVASQTVHFRQRRSACYDSAPILALGVCRKVYIITIEVSIK